MGLTGSLILFYRSLLGLSELLHTGGQHDGFVGIWAGTTLAHCQHVFITASETNTCPLNQEDMPVLGKEKMNRDSKSYVTRS